MARLSIRIDFESPATVLGPGMIQLLERISEVGSIRQAGIAMGMSYRKSWLLVQAMQETFGGPVVTTATGGAAGGGAQLTELGNTVLQSYRRMEMQAAKAVDMELRKLSALTKAGARSFKKKTPKSG